MAHCNTTSFFIPYYRGSIASVVGRMIAEASSPSNVNMVLITNFNGYHLAVSADSDLDKIVDDFYKSFDKYKK
ncbi:MAG: hypothetical protein WCJ59_03630 [bacterium]